VVMPGGVRVPLPCPDLPELVLSCIAAVQKHDSATHQASTWEQTVCRSSIARDDRLLTARRLSPRQSLMTALRRPR
jgi:hypothetical protein